MFNSTFKNAALSTLASAVVATTIADSPSFAGEGGGGGDVGFYARDYAIDGSGRMLSSEGGGMMQLFRQADLEEERRRWSQKNEVYTLEHARKEGLAYPDR